jgi:hypothetical protein
MPLPPAGLLHCESVRDAGLCQPRLGELQRCSYAAQARQDCVVVNAAPLQRPQLHATQDGVLNRVDEFDVVLGEAAEEAAGRESGRGEGSPN